ncbi:MarR family winged helix-turn-helix transcriptional regulator [Lachnospiraceae bacterium YH-ros2228]
MIQEEEDFLRALNRFHKLGPAFHMTGTSRGKMILMGTVVRLSEISPDGKVRVSDLVSTLQMPAPGVSRLLKGLEEEGLVVRTIDPSDRRNTLVSLTDSGCAETERGRAWINQTVDAITEGMGVEKIQTLTTLLNELYDQINRVCLNPEEKKEGKLSNKNHRQ